MIQHLRNKQENITRGPVRKQTGEKDWWQWLPQGEIGNNDYW